MEFGTHLKEWRGHRRMSQLELATEAGISARHLSFLETGRSKPSEGMILRLSGVLDIPAREQGLMFSAAGYRPRFATRSASGIDAMPPAVANAVKLILSRQDPYPGIVFDHEYNILLANGAFTALAGMAGVPIAPGGNFLEAYLGDTPLRSIIVNWERSAADLVHRIRTEAWIQGPRSPLSRRLERLACEPAVVKALKEYPQSERLPVLPVDMRVAGKTFSWITTLTSFGSAQDALVQGVLIESFFPADDATRVHFE